MIIPGIELKIRILRAGTSQVDILRKIIAKYPFESIFESDMSRCVNGHSRGEKDERILRYIDEILSELEKKAKGDGGHS
ncbi:MAG: hypothetical protein Q8873_00455 [Bacillota bacterium]|nr:hypothetical protein [Bacillota bacterium]